MDSQTALRSPAISAQGRSRNGAGSVDLSFNSDIDTQSQPDEQRGETNKMIVMVRSRPLTQKEIQKGYYNVVKIMDDKMMILYDPSEMKSQNDYLSPQAPKERQFVMDYIFN